MGFDITDPQTTQQTLSFDRERSIDERFETLLRLHPEIYAEFCRIARDLRFRGHRRYSAKGIAEVLRWHRAMSGADIDGLKINNDFTSRLSRKMIADSPEYGDFFSLRKLTSREEEE